ncbi:EboA domain-containing protein [Streptomyces javensis]|uniref:EboA domain-containing protein n=1 Tax=Streptomyces javensis TaxID=114698 RepID=UPI0031F8DAA3
MDTTRVALVDRLYATLSGSARAWLDQVLVEAAFLSTRADDAALSVLELRFAQAGWRCPGMADAARFLLLHTVRPEATALARLYEHGTAAERRAVLHALPHLRHLAPGAALPLVQDALRSNDTRLIAAAVGPYAAEHLPAHAWRHAVLKCLFTGVSLDAVADLAVRAAGDQELARMLHDYAAERIAAGRAVPEDHDRAFSLTTQES